MRLDNYLLELKKFDSRTKAKQAILRGEILVNNIVIDKPSYDIPDGEIMDIKRVFKDDFVSLGGFKLDKALKDFNYSVENLTVCDIGSSTGGFTDCLLQNGAKKVYAVDVNDNLLHHKIKGDKRVKFILKNAKYLSREDIGENLDLVTIDLSFISSTMIFPVLSNLIEDEKDVILLIKPQFENNKKISFKNGIIKDGKIRKEACKNVIEKAKEYNLFPQNFTVAPINDDKNIEYLILLKKNKIKEFNLEEYF